MPVLELHGLAQGVIDGRVGEGGQEHPEVFAGPVMGLGQAEDRHREEVRLPRAGRTPDQAEALVEDPLEGRELAGSHAVLPGELQGTVPDRGGHPEPACELVRPFDQPDEGGVGLPIELGQVGEDPVDIEVGEPLLQ